MKVLAINGSPHEKGAVYTAIRIIADELEAQGIEVDIVHVGNKLIHGCIACDYCGRQQKPKCVFIDDPVNECLEKAEQADGIILGSPVYYSGIAGPMKSFLDRFFYAGANLQFKVGTVAVSLRRSGAVDTFHQLNNYLNLSNTVITPGPYWNAIHGMDEKEVLEDIEGVQIMSTLGKNMAWLMKSIAFSKDSIPRPSLEKRVFTNFVR